MRAVHLRRYLALVAVTLLCSLGIRGDEGKPTVLLVSIDGFRWDYMEKAPTPNLRRFVAGGVHAKALIPVFPSATFPNHYTISTGLYPEHHGIVAHRMRDPAISRNFATDDRESMQDTRWWLGEPIWISAVKQGLISATCFWPGTDVEIAGRRPTYWLPFDGAMPDERRISQVVDWLSLPSEKRPQIVTLYFGRVDTAGHKDGPDSPQVLQAIADVDKSIGELLERLEKLGMHNINVIILSDHGMASISNDRTVAIDDYVDLQDVTVNNVGPVPSLIPPPGKEQSLFEQLKSVPHVKFYRREELPERLHFRNSPRIPPIVGLADEGWMISTRALLPGWKKTNQGGTHGYDNKYKSMHGFFAASGPAFQTSREVEPFHNIHIYELVAHILRITPTPNDGNLEAVRPLLRVSEPSHAVAP